MNNSYQPLTIEQFWLQQWNDHDLFKTNINKNSDNNYSICLPPPNVTGSLHLGHVLQHSAMDTLIRYHRMNGYNVLWQIGTDHAGIATQLVVENQLAQHKIDKSDIGREQFIDKVKLWKKESSNNIITQMKRLGLACDWQRESFTMDDNFSKIVKQVFIDLFHKNKIYKDKSLVNWDPRLKTALSDLEVTTTEIESKIWHIKYLIANSDLYIEIATTRPETMFGDVAIAINPDDDRYQHLIGKTAIIPIINKEIPIITDNSVDKNFGSGCVKITPAHDFHDYDLGVTHKLPMINIMTLDAKLNHHCPAHYQGLECIPARTKLINELTTIGHILAIKPHLISMPINEKTGTEIQPLLTDQWFMDMSEMASKALNQVLNNNIEFIPAHHINTYKHWMKNIKNWCISRQLWWGHRIPAYYKPNSNQPIIAHSLEEDELYQQQVKTGELVQDESVLDTWFSSALWCFATLGWPEKTDVIKYFFPTTVLVTGFDIIFFWVARMIMMTEECTKQIPFKQVYITGLVYDIHGKKMSKSKGNVIDPLDIINGINYDDLIKKRTNNLINSKQQSAVVNSTKQNYPNGFKAFGADALRWYMLNVNSNNAEIKFDINQVVAASAFANKIWNAGKYVLMQVQKYSTLLQLDNFNYANYITLDQDQYHAQYDAIDLININIINTINLLVKEVNNNIKDYRFDWLTNNIYNVFWHDFCDWFLELNKITLKSSLSTNTGDQPCQLKKAVNTLAWCFDALLKIMHPLIPFITEEIWQQLAKFLYTNKTKFLIENLYPNLPLTHNKISLLGAIDISQDFITQLKEIIMFIRGIRATKSIMPNQTVDLVIHHQQHSNLSQYFPYLKTLAKVNKITVSNNTLSYIVNNHISIEIIANINKKAEIEKNIKKLNLLLKNTENLKEKLANTSYQQKAPSAIIEKDKQRLSQEEITIKQLKSIIDELNQSE